MGDLIGLRRAESGDGEFCFRVHRRALGEYVDAVRGWDERAQRAYHQRNFDAEHTRIITVDGHDAGVLTVRDTGAEVVLGLIELDPVYQGKGIGGHVVTTLLTEAAARGQDVVLEVLDVNTRAKAFYERLGFVETGRPRAHKIALRYTAP